MKKALTFCSAFLIILSLNSCTKENLKTASAANVSAAGSDEATLTKKHLGESFGGGKIFYLDSTKLHGLIAATTDQSSGASWYNGTYILVGARGYMLNQGAGNTRLIIKKLGSTGSYAALVCKNYHGGGFTDWYLPSKGELNWLYKNRSYVGSFAATNYWSSTESDIDNAWDQVFQSETFQFADDKSFTLPVRAIRAF